MSAHPSLRTSALPDSPVSLAHPLHALPRLVGLARADVAMDDFGESAAHLIGRLGLVGKIVERAIARWQRHVEGSEGGTLTTQHAVKDRHARRELSLFSE